MALVVRITPVRNSGERGCPVNLECKWQGTFSSHVREFPITFSVPLTQDDKDTLRWYLDEFSSTSPFQLGKAKGAAQKIAVFAQAITRHIRAASALQRPLHQASHIVIELGLSLTDPRLGELPWEALEDTSNWHGAVRPDASICVVRSVEGDKGDHGQSQAIHPSGPVKNILLISSRSLKSRDILPDLLSLPIVGLVESLPVDQKPRLHFARPATWGNVCSLLEKHGPGFFDVVHFDVHGLYAVNGAEYDNHLPYHSVAFTNGF
jgi:hypothetical protein